MLDQARARHADQRKDNDLGSMCDYAMQESIPGVRSAPLGELQNIPRQILAGRDFAQLAINEGRVDRNLIEPGRAGVK